MIFSDERVEKEQIEKLKNEIVLSVASLVGSKTTDVEVVLQCKKQCDKTPVRIIIFSLKAELTPEIIASDLSTQVSCIMDKTFFPTKEIVDVHIGERCLILTQSQPSCRVCHTPRAYA
jgi:hypothetical protein